jgi:putative membrane protein
MTVAQIALAELRRLVATPMARIALLALCTVPLLYGGLYLWANQDPEGSLDAVPVALVVADVGATDADGTARVVGDEVAERLVDAGDLDWHRVTAASAASGVEDGTYDFSVTLPATFSADLLSAAGDDPRRARVVLETNDANGYLAGTIGERATDAILASVRESVGEEAAGRLLLAISDIRSGLVDASTGAADLATGATQAHDGSSALAAGTAELASGADALATGAGEVAAGAQQVADGAAPLASGLQTLQSSTATLPADAATLAAGAQQVADGDAQVAAVGAQLAQPTSGIAAEVPQTRADVVAALQAAGLDEAEVAAALAPLDRLGTAIVEGDGQAQTALGQLQQLAAGAQQVADGASRLSAAAPQLADGIAQAADGSSRLSDGATTLASGAAAAASGATTLAGGAHDAADGASALDDGLVELADGSTRLASGLDDAVGAIPDSSAPLRDDQAQTIADPVALDADAVASADSYGEGLAPFFLSLAAWIGIYALLLIVHPVSRRAVTALRSPVRVGIASWLAPASLGALQMLALFGIVTLALGFTLASPLGVLGVMLLASAAFAAIVVALNVWLGSVGQFLGLVLMVVQLVTAGGTFPWQTLPGPLAALHHAMPMTYAVEALRQVMYGGSAAIAWHDALVLALFGVGALVLVIAGVARTMDRRTLRDLQPSLIG